MELESPICDNRARAVPVTGRMACAAWWVGVFLAVAGCQAPAVKGDIRSDSPVEKIPGIVSSADTMSRSDYHRLVSALDDGDPAVRLFAAEALYRITGERKGYRYFDSAEGRRGAVARWQAWEQQMAADADPTGDVPPTEPGSQSAPEQEATVAAGPVPSKQ